jgi:hypothetical protein
VCSQWKKIEAALNEKVGAAKREQFAALTGATPELAPFASPQSLLAHLHARAGSDEERDRMLGALVLAARRRAATAGLARDVLWLALWPGLTALFRRTATWVSDGEDEAAAEIAEEFAIAIDRLEVAGCHRIAATLLWNTRRQVHATLRVRALWHALEAPFDEDAQAAPDRPSTVEVVDALEDLERELGEDAQLFVACLVEGLTTREAACRCGCGREAVKKRLQRIAARLRREVGAAADARSDVPER